MANRFNGFSQEEINRVAGGAKAKKPEITKQAFRGIRRMPEKSTRQEFAAKTTTTQQANKPPSTLARAKSDAGVTKKAAEAAAKCAKNNEAAAEAAANEFSSLCDSESSMSASIEEALYYNPLKALAKRISEEHAANENGSISDQSSILHLDLKSSNDDESLPTSIQERNSQRSAGAGIAALSERNTGESVFKGVSLRDFEAQRKLIQEQNKQKKEMLHKAIEHHSQKTAAETRKIEEIKKELAKLDNDLAVDVALLRKQIDNACIHFANIEKQYVKIEAQFLKAKIDLHNAAEKKELLTEHLCTVIAHNEDRKAQKLTELMEKVGLTPTGEYVAAAPVVIDLTTSQSENS